MAPRSTSTAAGLLLTMAASLSTLIIGVHGHGLLYEPRSRNQVAVEIGVDGQKKRGFPKKEYCAQCLNRNRDMCGTPGPPADYDSWLDSTDEPMPWDSQAVYTEGDVITLRTNLWAHHGGHMEVKACPKGRESTNDCLDANVLTFVEDLAYSMPADINNPERGYYAGGAGFNGFNFAMTFRLPEGMSGNEVLLQWRYVTANSCLPPGYKDYFTDNADNPNVKPHYWNPRVSNCPWPLPNDGSVGGGAPEQFFNCAEVTVLPRTGNGSQPTPTVPAPFSEPTSAPTARPTSAPTDEPTETVAAPSAADSIQDETSGETADSTNTGVGWGDGVHTCGPCHGGTSGPCQQANLVCWNYQVQVTQACYGGTYDCSAYQRQANGSKNPKRHLQEYVRVRKTSRRKSVKNANLLK